MNTPKFLPQVLLACFGLVACDADKATSTMDETNQSAMARIFLPDHTPAAKALVQAWRVDDSTKNAVAQTETSSDGSYRLNDLPDGLYRVVARKDGLVTMQDSMLTVAGRLSPRDDTLGNPAVATGFVKMTGSDKPSSVTILVMGTDIILYNVDISGSFKLEGLAAGTYRLRLSTTIENYTTTAATIRVSAGKTTDVGTIRMNFTGTPPVDSLAARIDSASNHVLLSWKLPTVTDFRFVRVYREPLDGSEEPILVGYSLGKTFRDSSVYNSTGTDKNWLYTTRIHTLDGDSGYPAWAKVTQPFKRVKALDLRVMSYYGWDSVYTGDTARVIFYMTASPDRPKSLVWKFNGVSHAIPVDSMHADPWSPYAYSDSMYIKIPCGDSAGTKLLTITLTGGDGTIRRDSLRIVVLPKSKGPPIMDSTRKDTTWRDTSRLRDSTLWRDSVKSDSSRGHDSTVWRDTVWNDTITSPDSTRHDSVRTDTSRTDSTIIPRDTVSLLKLQIVNLSSDSVVAGTRVNLVFVAKSTPYRAKSILLRTNGSVSDTLMLPGSWDSTRYNAVMIDSTRFSLDAGTTPGIRTLVATLTSRDGKSYTDSIRFVVNASKTKSVAMNSSPALAVSASFDFPQPGETAKAARSALRPSTAFTARAGGASPPLVLEGARGTGRSPSKN